MSDVLYAALLDIAMFAGRMLAIVVGGFAVVIGLLLLVESPQQRANARMLLGQQQDEQLLHAAVSHANAGWVPNDRSSSMAPSSSSRRPSK